MSYKKINIDNLIYNVKYFQERLPYNSLFCAVVKSNAYGHGIKDVIKVLNKYVDYYAVTTNVEALNVREYTNLPIIVLGGLMEDRLQEAINMDIEFTILKRQDILKLNNQFNKVKIHIAVNSGMNRLGIKNKRALEIILNEIDRSSSVELVGLFSHISDAKNKRRVNKQIRKFLSMSSSIQSNTIRHIANTDTCLYYPEYSFDMYRVGLGLYGYGNKNLKPVMQVFASIIDKQFVKKGEYVGYSSSFKAKKGMVVAVLDIGYAEGLPRLWSKKGFVIINNSLCKIVGNICMSMMMVDVTKVKSKIGDKAVIIGSSLDYSITAEDIAKACNTVPYEILTNFSKLDIKN